VTLDDLKRMIAYDEWANARLLGAASALSLADQERGLGGSFGSVRAVVAHVVGAEWLWLQRWRGENPSTLPPWLGESTVQLHARLAQVEAERTILVAALRDEDVHREVAYRLLNGTPGTRRLDELILHVVNHSTYHRGQIADMIRRLGVKPPSSDLLEFAGLAG
jgi:uncharacterized damage-inducible protein DinB